MTIILARIGGTTKSFRTIITFHKDLKKLVSLFVTAFTTLFACRLAPDFVIDIDNNFEPTYKISKDKKDVVKQLKKLADAAETIFLASDDDREGEAW